jgi:hypothetical protein
MRLSLADPTAEPHTSHNHDHEHADAAPALTSTSAPEPQGSPPLTADEVVAAFDCARARHGLPSYGRDAQLDREADALLSRLLRNGEDHLHHDEGSYALTGQLLLDSAYPSDPLLPCAIGGFDVLHVQDLDRSAEIGLAVAPVPNAYGRPMYLVLVLGR